MTLSIFDQACLFLFDVEFYYIKLYLCTYYFVIYVKMRI